MASDHGFSLVELLLAVAIIVVLSAATIPHVLAGLDEWRTVGAARYLSARLYQTRMEAAFRAADTAIRFTRIDDSYEFTVVMDGNRNGVRSRDIERGVDMPLRNKERLREHFGGVDFGTLPGLPPVDPESPPPGDDPVRFGLSNMVTFTPHGTSTPGSLYVRGRHAQCVVRVFGETGKIRILKFHPRSRQWKAL